MLNDIIAESIVYAIQKLCEQLEFNRKIEGVIVDKIDDSTYKVKIQNNISKIKSMNDATYEIGDIVEILVFNNNYSDKKILCKK